MPLAYNLLTEALNVKAIGSNGSAMAVVSGGGPVGEIVACWDILTGWGGGLSDTQPARIAVSAIATGQLDCRFGMAEIVARAGDYCAAHRCGKPADRRSPIHGSGVRARPKVLRRLQIFCGTT
jgi:hypothetical protein